MWSLVGIALALAVAAAAWQRSRAGGGFYDREIYGMDAASHRRYAILSMLFAGFFAIAYARGYAGGALAGLALYVLIAVFYAASFLRGASDE